jgi:hypothetical protein
VSEQEERGRAEETFVTTNGLSILGSLKERRQQVLEEQVHILPVPRWENPTIIVKYKPVEHGFIRRGQEAIKKAPKQKQFEIEIDVNADVLIRGCTAIVAVIDGVEYSLRPGDPNGEPTVFDRDLAENLGLDDRATARQVVRALFLTHGDILSAANSVIQFSGYRDTEADAAVQGE